MNFKKITAAAASLAAAAALAVSAYAGCLKVIENPPAHMESDNGKWMAKIYVPQDNIDFGIDPRELGKVTFTFTPTDPDEFEGMIGGAVVLSSGPQNGAPEDHNWPMAEYWGVYDDENAIYGRESEDDNTKPLLIQNTDKDYVYSLTLNVDSTNNVQQESYDSPSCYVQIALQDWGSEIATEVEVLSLELFDKSGKSMGKFNNKGDFIPANTLKAPSTESDTQAATAGDTAAPTTSSKGSPDTGIADVAAVAGIALIAGGALVISRKRK